MRTSFTLFGLLLLAGCTAGEATLTPTPDHDGGATANDSGVVAPPVDAGPGTGTDPVDDAQVVDAQFPASLSAGQQEVASVTMKNTGTTTWTKAGFYKLGAVDDSNPLASSARFELGDTEQVAPGGTRIFSIPLTGPSIAGSVVSDWRMVREGLRWFGAATSATVSISVPSSDKALTRFTVLGVDATISGTSVAVTLPTGTDVTHLTPTLVQTGVSVSPASGAQQNFTSPVSYTVTAADRSTQVYVVTVTVTPATGTDAIDLTTVQVFNSPTDVASWPITTQIHQLTMTSPDVGLSFTFPALATWPDYTPPGWGGALQYTVWAVVKVNGQWYTSGFIQMWNGRASTGAPILSDFAINWAYDGRWGPMMGHQPVVGEQMGFFVTAGNARGVPDVTSLRERSNVVMVSLPAGDNGVFNF